ncbi:MAG: ModD protein [Rhodospirillales bacterium]|nr:ModD protein [Rhodospirillales bacterium]
MPMMLCDRLLESFLDEDVARGDLTTHALAIGRRPGTIRFAVRAPAVVCCVEEAERLLIRAGVSTRRYRASGDAVEANTLLLEGDGPAAALHAVWKTAQTLLESACGIATAMRRIVEAARGISPDISVECTRKATPGTRVLAARSVIAGGGSMHRLGLSESILIFPQHAAFLGTAKDPGGTTALCERLPVLRRQHPGKKIMVEAWSMDSAVLLAEAGADVVQVDKFDVDAVRELVKRTCGLTPAVAIAAAGGINASNAAAYAATGCAALVTSAPYWAKPIDVTVTIEAR